MSGEQAATVRVGPAGWSYEDWKGIVYPPEMPRGLHPLTFLCDYFDTIEVNSTFYRPPAPRMCASWVDKVEKNPRFMFTAKLWQRFTHDRDTVPTQEEAGQVRQGLLPLLKAGKLGAVLAQFPWSFRRTGENRRWLAHIVNAFHDFPLALEIRHDSWHRAEVLEDLGRFGVAFCNIDQPLFDHSIEPTETVTGPIAYIRLHGRNKQAWFNQQAGRDERYNYLYSPEELAPWNERIRRMQHQAQQVYVITNNHFQGQAIPNALELEAALGRRFPPLPSCLVEHFPRLQACPTMEE